MFVGQSRAEQGRVGQSRVEYSISSRYITVREKVITNPS